MQTCQRCLFINRENGKKKKKKLHKELQLCMCDGSSASQTLKLCTVLLQP